IFSVRDLLQQLQRESNRAIVKRDGVVVATLQRPDLRPAAVGELRRQQILQAAQNRRAVSLPVVRRRGNHGEEAQFGGGGIVVQRPYVVPLGVGRRIEIARRQMGRKIVGGKALTPSARVIGQVEVLAPAAGRSLERDNDVGDAPRLHAAVPFGRFIQRHASGRG